MERFDLTMSYHHEADVFVSYVAWFDEARLRAEPREKDETAALFMSGVAETSDREAYAAELMRHLDVHSFGRRLRNRRLAEDRGDVTKLATIARYRFTLAFENAVDPDYVTEKLYEPLAAGSVPVYLGAPNVAAMAPSPKSFIDVRDFAGPAELAAHLRELERDPAAYDAHLAWKREPFGPAFQALLNQQGTHAVTRLCELISRA
jgi:alpha-1,3-fucosyltransferase 10